jgi:hypothetical protein
MVLSHLSKSNRERIRQAIILKIKRISLIKRQHPNHQHVRAKFLYFKEPVGSSNFRYDKIDSESPYPEDVNYRAHWTSLSNKELIEMYQKIKRGETFCFFLEEEGKVGKQIWNKDLNKYESI